jgi:single-stranded-DNA-specific exonuclease
MVRDELISALLKNRGLVGKKQIADFFRPAHPADIPLSGVGLSKKSVVKAVKLIDKHLSAGHSIAVYGDYDVDGICGTAVIWETLYSFSHQVFPYIPNRRSEGYGLSVAGIDSCIKQKAALIIVIDSGIVSHQQIKYSLNHGCEVLVIDHHQPDAALPAASAIVHSTATTATGLAWFLCREFLKDHNSYLISHISELLSLVAVSVICDLVPLMGVNRSLAKYGLAELNRTTRPGLLALFSLAGISPGDIGPYEVGFIIGPRLNAMGRLENAMDSLRLLCTADTSRARKLASVLEETNRLRQNITLKSVVHACSLFDEQNLPPLLIAAHDEYDEGVIGLVAARLVEKFYRPSVVISLGRQKSKASARSVPGFHITGFLRRFTPLFESVGGHAMAAGFTINTSVLPRLQKKLAKQALFDIKPETLIKNQRIDAEISPDILDLDFFLKLSDFAPFGLANPRPVFSSRHVSVSNHKRVGGDSRHLKFTAGGLDAIYFSAPSGVESGLNLADITYSLDLNKYNGRENLQMIIKQLTPCKI